MTSDAQSASGTLTFVFADAESFTELTESLGDEAAARCVAQFHALVAEAGKRHGGAEVNRMGDLVFLLFQSADDAVAGALEIQARLHEESATAALRCRIGIHTGPAFYHAATFIGSSVNKAARIAALATGGQILLSEETFRTLSRRDGVVRYRELPLRGLRGTHILYRCGVAVASPPAEPDAEQGNRFVGRETLVEAGLRALGEHGIVALVGPSGIGKSRIGREILHRAARTGPFPVGGIVNFSGCVDDPDAFQSALRLYAGDWLKTAGLLVLDNFETVVSSAPLLPAFLVEQPGLRLLVTTTVPLNVGEHRIVIPPMQFRRDEGAAAHESESMVLFRQRAREWQLEWEQTPADRQTAERVCALVEGIPLAIELAVGLLAGRRLAVLEGELRVARLKVLEARESASRQPRHTALRAAFAYSFSHLDPAQRRVLLRCAVLTADFDAAAAAAVCEQPVPDALGELARRGLLQETGDVGGPRYAMLDAVREFAREQLGVVADRYEELAAGHFLERADRDSSSLLTEDQVPALRRLQRELPHARAGMDWAIRSDRDEWIALYALSIWPILLYHGLDSECEERLRAGIAAARRSGDRQRECALWCRLAGPLGETGRYLELRDASRTGLELARQLGDQRLEARLLLSLGRAAHVLGNPAEAREHYSASLRLYDALDDGWGHGQAYEMIALTCEREGDLQAAAAAYDRALEIVRSRRDRWSEQRLLAYRGRLALSLGEPDAAEALLTDALRMAEEVGLNAGHLDDMVLLASLARAGERHQAAAWAVARCLSAAHALTVDPPLGLYLEAGHLARREGNLLTARAYFTDGAARAVLDRAAEQALANLDALLSLMEPAERSRRLAAAEPLLAALRRGDLPDEAELRKILAP